MSWVVRIGSCPYPATREGSRENVYTAALLYRAAKRALRVTRGLVLSCEVIAKKLQYDCCTAQFEDCLGKWKVSHGQRCPARPTPVDRLLAASELWREPSRSAPRSLAGTLPARAAPASTT